MTQVRSWVTLSKSFVSSWDESITWHTSIALKLPKLVEMLTKHSCHAKTVGHVILLIPSIVERSSLNKEQAKKMMDALYLVSVNTKVRLLFDTNQLDCMGKRYSRFPKCSRISETFLQILDEVFVGRQVKVHDVDGTCRLEKDCWRIWGSWLSFRFRCSKASSINHPPLNIIQAFSSVHVPILRVGELGPTRQELTGQTTKWDKVSSSLVIAKLFYPQRTRFFVMFKRTASQNGSRVLSVSFLPYLRF